MKYYFCSHQVQIYCQVIPKAKNEVGNHPRHDATLAADLYIAKTWILQSRFPMLFEVEILARMDSLEFSIFSSHFVRQSFQRIWKNIVFEESYKT